MRIKALSGDKPHPSYGGWWKFLTKQCEIRDTFAGVAFYSVINCNYIVWPDGRMVQNYGYHGKALMDRIRREGPEAVIASIENRSRELKLLLKKKPVTGK